MPPKPLILGFDTSAAHCAAALLSGDHVVATAHEEMAKGQAEALFPILETLLADVGATFQDLTALGVGTGPGNFTGVRISVSAARGLALSLGIPAVGVSVLEAAAFGTDGPVISAYDARRGAIYYQGFATPYDIPAQMGVLADLALDPIKGLTCIGPMATALAEIIPATVAPAKYALATSVVRLAALRWQDSPARPAPMYLRAADALPPSDPPPVIL